MRRLLLLLFCFVVIQNLFAQKSNDKQMKKAQDAYEAAMLQIRDGLVRDAVPLLGKAIEYDPNFADAYLSLAGVYGELKDYNKAVSYYEKQEILIVLYSLTCSFLIQLI